MHKKTQEQKKHTYSWKISKNEPNKTLICWLYFSKSEQNNDKKPKLNFCNDEKWNEKCLRHNDPLFMWSVRLNVDWWQQHYCYCNNTFERHNDHEE